MEMETDCHVHIYPDRTPPARGENEDRSNEDCSDEDAGSERDRVIYDR
jgi:hypothetical protein